MTRSTLTNYLQIQDFGAAETMLMNSSIAARLIPGSEFSDDIISELYINYTGTIISRYLRENEVNKSVKFVVINSGHVNAIAASGLKFDLIAVTIWTLYSFASASAKITSSSMFHDILTHNAKPFAHISDTMSRKEALVKIFRPDARGTITNVALAISTIAQMFVTYHELGHIINGHLRIDKVNNGNISELDGGEEGDALSEDDKLTIRTLEFDADAFAVQHTLMTISRFPELHPENPISLQVKGVIDAIHLTAAGVSLAMMCLQAYSWRSSASLTYSDDTHPPIDIRVLNALAQCTHIAEELLNSKGVEDGSFQKASTEGYSAVELSLCELTGVRFDITNMLNWAEISIPHNEEIVKRWAELRPALMRVKYGKGNLAPSQVCQ